MSWSLHSSSDKQSSISVALFPDGKLLFLGHTFWNLFLFKVVDKTLSSSWKLYRTNPREPWEDKPASGFCARDWCTKEEEDKSALLLPRTVLKEEEEDTTTTRDLFFVLWVEDDDDCKEDKARSVLGDVVDDNPREEEFTPPEEEAIIIDWFCAATIVIIVSSGAREKSCHALFNNACVCVCWVIQINARVCVLELGANSPNYIFL